MKKLMAVMVILAGCANTSEPSSQSATPTGTPAETIPAGYSFSMQLDGYPERFVGHFMFGVVNDSISLNITGMAGSAARVRRVTGQLLVEREGTRIQRQADGSMHVELSYLADEPDQNRRGVGTFNILTTEGGTIANRGVSIMHYTMDIDPHGTVALDAVVRDHSFRGGEEPVGPDLRLRGAGRASFGCSVTTPSDPVTRMIGVEMPDPTFRANPRCRELLTGW